MDNGETRQERREKKKQKRHEKIQQHGRSLVRIYKDAMLKRKKHKNEYISDYSKPKDL